MGDDVNSEQVFWDRFARYDPLWAILSDPSKTERRWSLREFLETGRREVSLLLYQLRALGIEVRRDAAAMSDRAYRASIRIESEVPRAVVPGSPLILRGRLWAAVPPTGAASCRIRRHPGVPTAVALPCRVAITMTAPREPGEYQLECDVVHEGISWFADKGSRTWRTQVVVGGARSIESLAEAVDLLSGDVALSLPDIASVESPGDMPMYGIHRDVVTRVVEEHGGRLVHLEIDERCGREWIGYRYFVRKDG